jgi:uncharacterized protein (DUF1800 family)
MLELFTLGAGRGYTESDVRQNARALTGFRNDWKRGVGSVNFRYDPKAHDAGTKTIFHKHGAFTWQDSVTLAASHPNHPSFFVSKLWSYFIPTPPDAATQHAPEHVYVASGKQIKPVVAAILKHPALFNGPRMVKSPALYNAGLLRRLGHGIDTTAYAWLGDMAGQRLFSPPNVAGWDDTRWLDTATWRGRWWIATQVLKSSALDPGKATQPFNAQVLLDSALGFWNNPPLGDATHRALLTFAQSALGDAAGATWKRKQYAVMTQNALRQLIAVSPEMQAA